MKTYRSDEFEPVAVHSSVDQFDPAGARSATEGETDSADGASLLGGQRWSLRRKMTIVQRLFSGEPMELVSREIGVPIYQLDE